MGAVVSWISGGTPTRDAPPTISTDEILPTYFFDDTKILRAYTLMWTFRFNEVLDPDKLHEAMSKLFHRKGWRRLGGRLRLRPDGRAEIHVPREFSPDRPPVNFSKVHHEMPMTDHPEASKLPSPQPGDEPVIFPSAKAYASLGVKPDAPKSIDDYFYSDAPLFALHVVTFTDGSLVSLSFNHSISDLGGLVAVLNAWQLVLAGKDDQVAEFIGYDKDPMEALYQSTPVEQPVTDFPLLRGWGLMAWALRHLVETWWTPMESHTLCIPRRVIDSMVKRARKALDDELTDKAEDLFISENDVLVALSNRCISEEQSHDRSIVTLMAVDPRSRVKSVFRSNMAYVGNAPSAALFYCSAGDILNSPLGRLAIRSRQAISAQCTEEQLKAAAASAYRRLIETKGALHTFGDISSKLLVISNWSKASFYESIDFSPAIIKPSPTNDPGVQPGRPIYYHSEPLETNTFGPTIVTVMGRDAQRNLWLSGSFPKKTWQKLLEYLGEYA